jgi:Leu/Phe-tRNA-protein transferase
VRPSFASALEAENPLPETETSNSIEHLSPALLDPEILAAIVYPRLGQTHYWTDSWDPDFYVTIARAGFICVSIVHPDLGAVLIPELQQNYAVLDWENLHYSRKVRRLMASGQLEESEVELRVTDPGEQVLDCLLAYHCDGNWIHEPYQSLVRELAPIGNTAFAIHGVELWARESNELIAGELGYSVGGIYTSLSGFCARNTSSWNHSGTLQQVLLARALQERGYHFWNMGDVSLPYKRALGAQILPRAEFLERWQAARDITPIAPMRNGNSLCRYTKNGENNSALDYAT